MRTKKDAAPPLISSVRIDNALLSGRTHRLQTVVSWRTDEIAHSIVYFEEGIGVPEQILANKVGNENELTTPHIVIVTSLKPATVYRIQLSSLDESGNIATTSVRTILTRKQAESVLDVILKNLEDTFGFLKRLRR